ncbi:MAG: transposase, partial [Gammaproteobacteria bacterium]|nr:transposase [Gammaproteobacteria bacterium]
AASVTQMLRFETEMLFTEGNLDGLETLNRTWVRRATAHTPSRPVILDLDSSESPTYGTQERALYNGHFARTCYHPLFCFNQSGDLEGAMLREGNVASAHEWRAVLEPVVESYRSQDVPIYFRADAAFAMPAVYEYLEENEVLYAIRIKANAVLERHIEHLLRRRVGRPSKRPEVHYASFEYRAKSWDRSRRVVAKVEWHAGELFPRVGFIVTNLNR